MQAKAIGLGTQLGAPISPPNLSLIAVISLEGTLASAAGSVLMTVVFVGLFTQPPTRLAWGEPALLVASIGLLATLLESLMGALVQHRVRWLTNELVNGLQTFVAAFLAIAFAACLGWGSV